MALRAPGALAEPGDLRKSVVKVFVRSAHANWTSPWQTQSQTSSTGSGFCIDASRQQVLTNAHVVSHAVVVRVRRYGQAVSYPASVLCSSPQCDLAVLEVTDSGFWEGLGAIELSEEIPPLDADVLTVGYPMGGENICVTRGVVSRIDLMDYTFSPIGGERQLVIQVDAAINPGNSGGPVLDAQGRAVGVAFAGLRASANIGYVIPGAVVHFFLRSLRGTPVGLAKGLCSLGVRLQHAKSPALRRLRGLEEARGDGVLVTDVAPQSPAADAGIQVGDVLLAVDGVPVAEDGTVPLRDMERIGFEFLITRKVVGETMRLQLLRAACGDKEDRKAVAVAAVAARVELELQADYVEKLVPRRDGGRPRFSSVSERPVRAAKSPDLSLPSFQSRLAEWGEQCLRFQASRETWVPTKPCCPANPFLDLEACRWQGLKNGSAKACVQLLSIEELCELHRFFLENPHHELSQEQPEASNPRPNLICMQMRPWGGMQELSTADPVSGPASSVTEPSEVEPSSAQQKAPASGSQVRGVYEAQARARELAEKLASGSTVTEAVATPLNSESAVNSVYFHTGHQRWAFRLWDFCAKEMRYGGSFESKEEAEAKARELAEKLASGSAVTAAVKGVQYCKKRQCWRVAVYDPSTRKVRYGGSFESKKAADAKAPVLAKKLKPKPKPAKASDSAVGKTKRKPGSDVKGVYWSSARTRWQVRVYDPSRRNAVYAGSFRLQKEAEARARKPGKNLGLQGKRKRKVAKSR
ncbi:DEGP9 [Symbiodinium sp. CCMP2592]|nr:DEGP9 [Symbiodinium sp. CCMP2592]